MQQKMYIKLVFACDQEIAYFKMKRTYSCLPLRMYEKIA